MLFKSPTPDVAIQAQTWPDYFFECIAPFPGQIALIEGATGREISYRELGRQIRQFAAWLQQSGYGKGDVIALYAPNSPEYVVAFQAILSIGAVVTPANPMYTASELAHQLNHAGARCLVSCLALYDKVSESLSDTAIQQTVLLDSEAANTTGFSQCLEQAAEASPQPVAISPDDLAVLPFSSGTTGLPKGVMLNHSALVAHNIVLAKQKDASMPCPQDSVIATLPFFHIYGISVIMNLGLTHGSSLVVMSSFDPVLFLTLLQKHRITRAYLVPPIILFLAKHPDVANFDVDALNYICSGAAPLGEELAKQVAARLDCKVVQGYGMTEMSPATHFTPDLDQKGLDKPASIGVLIPNTQAKIIDIESGEPQGYNQQGELLVKGPQMMKGYLNNPEATAATIDAEGWLHTGDIAYVDEDEYFYIVDRLKEFIKYKGYQVAPAELEAILLTHDLVDDVAVVPFPDEEAGEIPKAFVVAKSAIDADALMNWLADQVAPFKKVRQVEFVEQIPKSPSGKILRRLLK